MGNTHNAFLSVVEYQGFKSLPNSFRGCDHQEIAERISINDVINSVFIWLGYLYYH